MARLLRIIAPAALAYAWRNRNEVRQWLDRRNAQASPALNRT